ncbi:MAG: co-chaperone GroES [Desulfitobacteriaceae bacterium]|nr:co-chaperone GroES [Desulfitobacteriaceae bacterium]MDI6879396.1 co-chaperone GroES [Desulfitobacteriaceae bacterium]MDI6913069.1 co-chaperone GroES [Desulfitobacteriaceae bacterium]
MKIKPLDDRVLVKPVDPVEKTQSGIYLPDTAKEKSQEGIVVAVGTDDDLQSKIKEGDKVLFAKYGGTEIKIANVDHIILSRADILAVIED